MPLDNVNFRSASDFVELANKIFEEEKTKILQLLPDADVQHIGRTENSKLN